LSRRVALSALVAVVGYLGFSLWAGWREVVAAFAAVGVGGFALALGLSSVNYALRFARWQHYLAALGHPMPAAPSASIYLAGFAFTTTPGKAGELLRGIFLANHGVPILRATAAFISERLSDLVAVILISLPGLAILPYGGSIVAVGLAGVAAVILALAFGDRLDAMARKLGGALGGAAQKIAALLREARRCHGPGATALATVLSIVAWSAEALAFHLVLQALGVETSLWYAMAVYALAMLAGAISFLPGGLGGTEAVMVAMLTLHGAPEPQAVAATIVIRVATLWFAVALGLLAIVASRRHLHPDPEPA
jgi:uncharacterized membrane protein YbhN (UPF0104 family)